MTWRWLICFSLAAAAGVAANFSGKVVLRDSSDQSVKTKSDYSGVVVSLKPLNNQASAVSGAPQRATVVQKNKTFIPHVTAIVVGSSVDFPNFDPIFHNAFSNYSGQLFDIGLYPPGTSRTVKFTRPGIVRIFCNIHSTMSAVVAVLDTPYFAVTGPDGSFAIPNVPPGEYTLSFFHERAVPAVLDRLSRRITVDSAPVALPPVAISETGYLPLPHKDKFGRDYRPQADEHTVYPGARK